ncbi:MAG: hypothetical protein ACP5QT_04235 [Brevinematia bacterium]
MTKEYIIFLVSFVVVLSVFAYINTRYGLYFAFKWFLRIALPMVLSAIIVKVAHFISDLRLVSYIVGGIGFVIFFIVFQSAIRLGEEEKKPTIVSHFLGCLLGLIQGWLVIGLIVDYLNFFGILKIQNMIPPAFFNAIVTPLRWFLFFDFIKF